MEHFDIAAIVLLGGLTLAIVYMAARLRDLADQLQPFLSSGAYRALAST